MSIYFYGLIEELPSSAAGPFSQTDWSAPKKPASSPQGLSLYNLALLTAVVAAPFVNPDMSQAATRTRLAAPDQLHTNIGRFTNPIPFVSTDRPRTMAVRVTTPQSLPLNLNLFKNPIPFSLGDWSVPFRTPDFQSARLQPVNLNLTAVVAPPFAQLDWSSPRRAPDFLAAAQPYNQLVYSEVPFSQADWPQTYRIRSLPGLSDQAILEFVIPFAQYDWSKPLPPRTSVSRVEGANIALTTANVAAPFYQTDWSKSFAAPKFAPPPQSYNISIYSEVPFSQSDWSASRRTPDFLPAAQPYNSLIFSEIPFNQDDWSKPLPARSAAVTPPAYNLSLYTVTVTASPFIPINWSRSRAALSTPAPLLSYNNALYTVIAAAPFVPIEWSKPFTRKVAPAQAAALNLNLFTNPVPFALYEWGNTRTARAAAAPAPLPLNLSLSFTMPFAQFHWPTPRRLPSPIVAVTLNPRILDPGGQSFALRILDIHGAMPPSEFGTVLPDGSKASSKPSVDGTVTGTSSYRKLTDKGALEN